MQQDIYTDPATNQIQLQQQFYGNKKKKPLSFSNSTSNFSTKAQCPSQTPTTQPPSISTNTDYSSYNEVLEHSLYQLLRATHQSFSSLPMPHPTSTPLSLVPWRNVAGPQSFSKSKINHLSEAFLLFYIVSFY